MIESDYLQENGKLIDDLKKMSTLSPFEEKDLHGLLRLSKIRKYKSGELIIEEGSRDFWVYLLIFGSVKITKDGEEIALLKRRGDVFGEMSMINGSTRSASAYAASEVACLAIDTAHINKLTGHDKMAFYYVMYRISLIFAETLSDRLRVINFHRSS